MIDFAGYAPEQILLLERRQVVSHITVGHVVLLAASIDLTPLIADGQEIETVGKTGRYPIPA